MKFNSITGGSTSGTMWDGMGNKMSEATDVVIETRPADGVALLELNRPDALNAVNMDVRQKLAASADSLVEDPDIRVIVIAGRGGNFAAGSDVKVLRKPGRVVCLHSACTAIGKASPIAPSRLSRP